jgi:predicted kinase
MVGWRQEAGMNHHRRNLALDLDEATPPRRPGHHRPPGPLPAPGPAAAGTGSGLVLRPAGVQRLGSPGGSPPVTGLRYPRGSVVVVGGIPGAGKTTLLRRLAATQPDGAQVRVLDPEAWRARLRRLLGAWLPYRVYRPLVHLLYYASVARAVRQRGSLLVHETGTRPGVRRWLCRLARRPVHWILLDVDLLSARRGQVDRGRVVRREALRGHWRRWQALREQLLDPGSAALALDSGCLASCLLLDRRSASDLATVRFD